MLTVQVKDEMRKISSYNEPSAEEMPMFAENRNHQRSSGNPYPCKVVMKVDRKHKEEKLYRVITLENDYVRLELLPGLGGRIYSAYDKRTGYDFFYKQHVIKPALIGMLGSWISGGCEFNWPCHHRPSTFMPTNVYIEYHENGAVTVWMGENEPLDRMNGTVGIHLEPGEARFDTRIKVYNRTPVRHSFLWWENAAVPVNEHYRLIFPPDVHYVQFHYRKNVTTYPIASGVYNGIQMGDARDISYHKNSYQPTSYFCSATKYDFFGGYDEGKQCGVIHVSDHTVSVGKKMFTWAYNQLSSSWEKALTDTDGAYAELMASSYSLNQPDFTWLMPYEGREFSQMWYPVGSIGTPFCACSKAAVSVSGTMVSLQSTVVLNDCILVINGQEYPFSATPENIVRFHTENEVSELNLLNNVGKQLLYYEKPSGNIAFEMPTTIPDNPTCDKLKTAQECYLMGVHVEQYRDPIIRPDRYWKQALEKDPEYVPALTAMAGYELNHFRTDTAYKLAMRAWKKVTMRNFHPESGELQYLIARILEAQDSEDEAWEWYMQSAWQQDARSRALTRAAMIESRKCNYERAGELAREAVRACQSNRNAQLILCVSLIHQNAEKGKTLLEEMIHHEPLDMTYRVLMLGAESAFYEGISTDCCQTVLDTVSDLYDVGENDLAVSLLRNLPQKSAMTQYLLSMLTGEDEPCKATGDFPIGIAYPSRGMEYKALKHALNVDDKDANALNLLGCLLYANENYAEAAELWSRAITAAPLAYMPYRNLSVSYYSHLGRKKECLGLLNRALELRPHDAQLIWEKSIVMQRCSENLRDVIHFLEVEHCEREDVIIELCQAYNLSGEYEKALNLLGKTSFTPCEGGEHAIADQYMFAHHAIGRRLVNKGINQEALKHFEQAQLLPEHLGTGLWNEVKLVPHQYYSALCLQKMGCMEEAETITQHILCLKRDYFSDMHLPELPCWQAMAYKLLGLNTPAQELIAQHIRNQGSAFFAVDAGFAGTTPFYISYMENSEVMRKASCYWQLAMAYCAAGDMNKSREMALSSLKAYPINLYATLLL